MKTSFDDRGLRRLQENLRNVTDTHEVPLTELLNPDFMRKHTSFASFEVMLAASPFTVETAEDFTAIPEDQWEFFVCKVTPFDSWLEMQKEAGVERLRGRLLSGLG
jgi:hypothetical protein